MILNDELKMWWKEVVMACLYYSSIYLEVLRNAWKLCEDTRCLDWLTSCVTASLRWCIQNFPDWVDKKYMLKTTNTHWDATQRIMAAKLTTLAHKIAIQLHLVAESCIICCSRSRRPVRKLLDTPSYRVYSPSTVTEQFSLEALQSAVNSSNATRFPSTSTCQHCEPLTYAMHDCST